MVHSKWIYYLQRPFRYDFEFVQPCKSPTGDLLRNVHHNCLAEVTKLVDPATLGVS